MSRRADRLAAQDRRWGDLGEVGHRGRPAAQSLDRVANRDGPANTSAVGIAGDEMDEAVLRESNEDGSGVFVEHVRGRDLDQCSFARQLGEPLFETWSDVPLRVGDDSACPDAPEGLHRLHQTGGERSGRGLYEQPCPGPAERGQFQVIRTESVEFGLGDLGSGRHNDADTSGCELIIEGGDTVGELVEVDHVVVTDMGGRADRRDAIGFGLSRHGDGVSHVCRAVIDAGEDVAMQIGKAGWHGGGEAT